MLINFRKKITASLFFCVGKEEIHKYVQYEVMTVYMGRTANQRKVPKSLPFQFSEVSMSNPEARRVLTQNDDAQGTKLFG